MTSRRRTRSDSGAAQKHSDDISTPSPSPTPSQQPPQPVVSGNIIARTSARAAQRVYNADAISLRAARPLSWKAGLLSDFGAGVTSWAAGTEALRRANESDETAVVVAVLLVASVVLASSLLGVVALRRFVDLHPGTVRLVSVVAIASFWLPTSAPDWLRVAALVVGVTADQCALFANLFERGERRRRALSGLLLAFVSIHLLLIRHSSQLRVFTAPFANAVTVLFALFAAAWSGIERAASLSLLEQQLAVRPDDATWLTPSLALGSALFLMIWLAREHSVVARCCGLPLFGDDDALVPAGLVPTIALLIGVFIAFIRPQFVRSALWLSYGCISAALFWHFAGERDLALIGGAGVIVFGTALLPTMTAEMTRTRLLGRAAACTMLVMFVGLRAASDWQEAPESRAVLLGVPMALIAVHYLASGWQAAVEIAIQSPEKTTFLPRRELIGALVALTLLFTPTVFRLL